MKKLVIVILAAAVLLGACAQLDVIYKYSRKAFEEIAGGVPGAGQRDGGLG
jgi:major membrane immunogen (membrane-anchored lipoprotein)